MSNRKPHTPETRAKISAANARRIVTEDTRAKMSAGRKGRKQPPETVAKRAEKIRKKNRDTTCAKCGTPREVGKKCSPCRSAYNAEHYPVSSIQAKESTHLCECGCGEYTFLAKKNSGNGNRKGEPRRFISGHQSRIQRDLKFAHLPRFIDPCDADLIANNYYGVREKDGRFYLQRGGSGPNRMLHRDIGERIAGHPLGSKDIVDHRNGNGLDNRRRNLRVVTTSINMQNRIGLDAKNTSGYRGVSWSKTAKKWIAGAAVNGKSFNIGAFESKEEANRAVIAWRIANMPGYIHHATEDNVS